MITSGFLRVSLRHWRYKLRTSFCRPDRRAIVNYICRIVFSPGRLWSSWPREYVILVLLTEKFLVDGPGDGGRHYWTHC